MYSTSGSAPSGMSFSMGENEHGAAQGQRKQPMVELIESNTKLNQELDRVRKEYKTCLDDMEATKENIEQITQVDRIDIQEQTTTAIKEQEDLLKTLAAMQADDLCKIQAEEYKSKVARDQAHDRLRVAQEIANEQPLKFMKTCEEYRTKIQRLACQGECLGMQVHFAPLLACAVLQGRTQDGPSAECEVAGFTGDINHQESWNTNFDRIVSSLWEVLGLGDTECCESDVELKEALKALEEQKASGKVAEASLQEVLKEKNAVVESREKKNSQYKSLQAQFQRLNDDVQQLHSQTKRLQQETGEANNMASIYEKDIESLALKREAAAAAAREMQNPYSKRNAPISATRGENSSTQPTNSSTITPPSNSSRSRKKSQYSRDIRKRANKSTSAQISKSQRVLGPTSTQQFPHRSGRVRSSRFGASLRVSSMDVLASSLGEDEKTLQESGSDDDTFSAAQTSKKMSLSPRDRGGGIEQASVKRRNYPSMEESDEDEEDDEALFSYNPFPKKTK